MKESAMKGFLLLLLLLLLEQPLTLHVVVACAFVLRIHAQGVLVGFHRLGILLLSLQHRTHVVVGLRLSLRSADRLGRLLVLCEGLLVLLLLLQRAAEIVMGRAVGRLSRYRLAVAEFRLRIVALSVELVALPYQLAVALCARWQHGYEEPDEYKNRLFHFLSVDEASCPFFSRFFSRITASAMRRIRMRMATP